jgi:tetratricopeptide (TPR) repeat protein
MGTSLPSEETIREYLLGRVSDEATLEELEELLFSDEEFCTQVALVEDGLINDFVLERLNPADAQSFRATLATDPDRRFKLKLTQALREKALSQSRKAAPEKLSFFAALLSFFRQPMYAGAFALLLIAALVVVVYLSRPKRDDLAELRSMYRQARPTETRISDFGYAPLLQLRGAPEPAEKTRLRRIENSLIEATEKNPGAPSYHALGVFYVTQGNYADAIKDFESALKFDNNNAKLHNDLGTAHFELAKMSPGKNFAELAQGLEEFTKATALDSNLLEALFNKALAQQQLGMPRQARESWTLYLQKDPSSQWADEARKNLARIQSEQTLFKKKDEVLADFLAAYRHHDDALAQKIHNETKGGVTPVTLPLQLSQRYLQAKQNGHDVEARESLDAMAFIGRFEQEQHSEFFFLSWQTFTRTLA